MKISSILAQKKTSISFEIFPPKEDSSFDSVTGAAEVLGNCGPDFISVTCRGGGGTMRNTVSIASWVQEHSRVPALAHLTCIASTREQIRQTAVSFTEKKIENILALRGDIPQQKDFVSPGDYRFACDLISGIKEYGNFCIGGACYPEGHPESSSGREDMDNLKRKADAGCDFLTTQMFFDNTMFYDFLSRSAGAGITIPVIAGIMPLTNGSQIKRMISLSNAFLPERFLKIINTFDGNNEALKEAGIAYATQQIIDLIANGVRGIHIYTMNKPDVAKTIMSNITEIKAACGTGSAGYV